MQQTMIIFLNDNFCGECETFSGMFSKYIDYIKYLNTLSLYFTLLWRLIGFSFPVGWHNVNVVVVPRNIDVLSRNEKFQDL